MTTYNETIAWLFQQFPSYQNLGANAYKPSLDNIIKLCDAFNTPQKELQFIHVAGSNGKGSTCSMLASILTEAGYTVGLFTSPHIVDFRERMRVNGTMPSEAFIIETVQAIQSAELDFEPSFFEITFLVALLYFQVQQCTICVIETGLGGRLDATNVIQPIVSLITNISLEHTNFLGDSIEKIAFEKAGIVKHRIPLISTERSSEAIAVFKEKCASENSLFIQAPPLNELPTNFPLLGDYQRENFALVKACLEELSNVFPVTAKNMLDGLTSIRKNTGFFGRLQVIERSPLTIMDVSHNADGLTQTIQYVRSITKGKLHIIYGTSADKDLAAIFPIFQKEHFYFTEFSNQRSCKIEQLKENAEKFQLNATFFSIPSKALALAQKSANKEDTILITGSFFLLADFF